MVSLENCFIGYIGDHKIHDSNIQEIFEEQNDIRVFLKSPDGDAISIRFLEVKSYKSCNPIGMMLYAICEKQELDPFRRFVFINWDEEDNTFLEVVAKRFIIELVL
jgi:hypothetical protein